MSKTTIEVVCLLKLVRQLKMTDLGLILYTVLANTKITIKQLTIN